MDGGPGGLQSMGSLKVGQDSEFTFTFHFHALEKEMATHFSVLAWRIQGTEELWWAAVYEITQSWTRLKRLSSISSSSRRRKWQPTPVFFPAESQGRQSLVGCHLWGCTESDTTEAT